MCLAGVEKTKYFTQKTPTPRAIIPSKMKRQHSHVIMIFLCTKFYQNPFKSSGGLAKTKLKGQADRRQR
jgi:hypothetical protein